MYIRYTPDPQSTTRTGGVIRDIARAISSSSISSHEFSDGISDNNTIEGTLSHGWALDSRDTISTDATPAQNDMKYRLYNNTAVTGVKKAFALRPNGTITHSTIYNGTHYNANGSGPAIFPLMAYEATEEYESWGYNGNNGGYSAYNVFKANNNAASKTYHIFANQKYIIMAGFGWGSGPMIQGYIEVDKTPMHHRWEAITGRTSPSAIYFMMSGYNNRVQAKAMVHYGHANPASSFDSNMVQFPEMCVNGVTGAAYKCAAFGVVDGIANGYAKFDDGSNTGTATGLATNGRDYPITNYHSYRTAFYNQAQWNDTYLLDDNAENETSNINKPTNYYQDASGTKHIPLYPLLADASMWMSGSLFNLSKYCPIYSTLGMQGSFGDTMTVGSDKYIYLGAAPGDSYSMKYGFFMKVE
jgi:hypothetical protein